MKFIFTSLIPLSLFFYFQKTTSKNIGTNSYHMPAEWSPQEAVWLSWYYDFDPYQKPIIDITKVLYKTTHVKMVAGNKDALAEAKTKLMKNGIDTSKISFYIIEDNRLWMRDHGATYLVNDKGQGKVADFRWSMYGNDAYLRMIWGNNEDSIKHYFNLNIKKTGLVDSVMGSLLGLTAVKTDVNMEGGAIEVNGKGSLILSETVTFHRNPTLSRAYIESEFRRVLGVSQIIWMKRGLAEDPCWFDRLYDNYYSWGTYGHTDEFVRFANESTILLAWVDESEKDKNPINKLNYERMAENLAILEKARDQNGKPFKIIKVPLPDLMYLNSSIIEGYNFTEDLDRTKWKFNLNLMPFNDKSRIGDTVNWVATSSYLNYFVTNDAVLLPTYVKEGSSAKKEQKVREIFSSVFPKRKLIFLDVMNLNYYGGGIHCVTQQEPKIKTQPQ